MYEELKEIVKNMEDLPSAPRVAAQALKILENPDLPLSRLAEVICQDPAIPTRILKVVNSAFYRQAEEITSLERAILLLGEQNMRDLLIQSSISSLNAGDGVFEKRLSAESSGCAMATQIIALGTECADPHEAFLAGMLCHIGKMVMLRRNREMYREVVARTRDNPANISDVEIGFFAFSHDQIGAALLDYWKFAPLFVQATLHHHDFPSAEELPEKIASLAAAISLADGFCRHLGIGHRTPEKNLDLTEHPGALALALAPEEVQKLLALFQEAWFKRKDL